MAGSRKNSGPVNYHELPRRKLQSLCKKYGFPANKTNVAMADALTALLNAPERLARGIDSPAISSRSSYFSSSEVDESPMITPGVDSLPTISELRPEVFQGLRITKLPEIMEVETSPQKEVPGEMSGSISRCEAPEMQPPCEVISGPMTDNPAAAMAKCPVADSNGQELEVSEKEQTLNHHVSAVSEGSKAEDAVEEMERSHRVEAMDKPSGNGQEEQERMDCSDIITEARIDDLVASAGLLPDEELKDVEFSESCQSDPDGCSRNEELVSENETKSMKEEEEEEGTSGSQLVDKSEHTADVIVGALVAVSDLMGKSPLPASEEMIEASDCRMDEEIEPLKLTTASDLWSETSAAPRSEDRMKGFPVELRETVSGDTIAERGTDQAKLTPSPDQATNVAIIISEPTSDATAEAGDDTPIPTSFMAYSPASDLSVTNKGVKRIVDLRNRHLPRNDRFTTDVDNKLHSQTSEGMESRTGSQRFPSQETEILRMAWIQDEVFGFKCLNPAALSPKVRRSLGIDIPKIPVSRLTFSPAPKSGATSGNEKVDEFSLDAPLISPVIGLAALANFEGTDFGLVIQTETNTKSLSPQNTSTDMEIETTCLSSDEKSETTQLVPADDETRERLEASSPVPGYVKEIVNLLEKKSEEEESRRNSAGAGAGAGARRKDVYKQSPLVRLSRIAAERAVKLGQGKRAAVLAGKRSLWPSTNSSGALQEAELPNTEEADEAEALQSTSSGSLVREDAADSSEEHDAYGAQEELINAEDEVLQGSSSSSLDRDENADVAQEQEFKIQETEAVEVNDSGSLIMDVTADVDQALPAPHAEESSCVHTENESSEMDTPVSPQHDQMNAEDIQPDGFVPNQITGELKDEELSENYSSPTDSTETEVAGTSGTPDIDQQSSADDVMSDDSPTAGSDEASCAAAGFREIKYVEIPRPVETNVECGPISELSWIRKATNLPTPKAQKVNEKVKRPISANLRKFELMERAALNAAKKHHRTPKKTTSNAKGESPDTPEPNLSGGPPSSSEGQEPTENVLDVEMEEGIPAPVSRSLKKSPDKSPAPLSLRNCNKDLGISTVESPCPASPKSPAISLEEILRESSLSSTGKENLRGKESEQLRRHQDEYKTPLTGRSKKKALRTAELNAASLREKLLKQRRGIEGEAPSAVNTTNALKTSLLGRLL